jgi:hypothetical protein
VKCEDKRTGANCYHHYADSYDQYYLGNTAGGRLDCSAGFMRAMVSMVLMMFAKRMVVLSWLHLSR